MDAPLLLAISPDAATYLLRDGSGQTWLCTSDNWQPQLTDPLLVEEIINERKLQRAVRCFDGAEELHAFRREHAKRRAIDPPIPLAALTRDDLAVLLDAAQSLYERGENDRASEMLLELRTAARLKSDPILHHRLVALLTADPTLDDN